MKRIDSRIAIAADEENGWIFRAFFDVVIRRILVYVLELFWIFGRTIFRDPKLCLFELLIAKHVQKWSSANGGGKEIWSLRYRCADQQPSVRDAENRLFIARRHSRFNQVFRSSDEIIEHILLFLEHARPMPRFSELTATT